MNSRFKESAGSPSPVSAIGGVRLGAALSWRWSRDIIVAGGETRSSATEIKAPDMMRAAWTRPMPRLIGQAACQGTDDGPVAGLQHPKPERYRPILNHVTEPGPKRCEKAREIDSRTSETMRRPES